MIILEIKGVLLPEFEEAGSKEAVEAKGGGRRHKIFLALYTTISIAALQRNSPLHGVRLQLCWLFSQIIIYFGLFRRVSRSNRIQASRFEEALHTATELATLMVVTTGVLVTLWWKGMPSLLEIGLVGALKACRWMSLLILVNKESALFLSRNN